jgi:hypothetical protein
VAVSYVATSTAETSGTASSLALGAFPTGVAVGDVLVLVANARNGSPTPQWATAVDPAGWTRIGTVEAGAASTEIAAVAWWAIYTGSLALPTADAANTASIALTCSAFRGVDLVTPISSWTSGTGGATSTVTVPAVTWTPADGMAVAFAFGRNTSTTGLNATIDGGYTERADIAAGSGASQSVVQWTGTQATTGAALASQTVTYSATLGTRASGVVVLRASATLDGVADPYTTGLTWHVDIKPTVVNSDLYLRVGSSDSTSEWYEHPQSVLGDFMLAGAADWVDITSVVQSMDWGVSKRSTQLGQFQAGQASVTVVDRDRDFDPLNLDGAYANGVRTGIRPGVPLRIWCTYPTADTVTYLFYGWVDSWDYAYEGGSNGAALVTISASDSLAKLARVQRAAVAEVGEGEFAIDRFYRVLDSAAWPGDLVGSAQAITSTADLTDPPLLAGTTLDGDPLSELQAVADAVGGAVYADGTGRIIYAPRRWYTDRIDTPTRTFSGDQTAAIPCADFDPSYDRDELVNVVTATRDGGVAQTATDAASVADFGPHGATLTGLPLLSDGDALSIAKWRVWWLGQPRYRVRQVRPLPRVCTSAGLASLLAMQHLDLVTIAFDPPGGGTISQNCWVEGWSHSVDARTGEWTCSVALSDATQIDNVMRLNDDSGVLYDPSTPDVVYVIG